MRQYIPAKKNLFIFGSYPDMFSAEDTFLIIGKNDLIHKIDLDEIENIFSIYTIPIWIKHILKIRNINIFFIDDQGELKGIFLNRKHLRNKTYYLKDEIAYKLLRYKAEMIDKLYQTREGTNFLKYSLRYKHSFSQINKNLDFIPKAFIMDSLKLNYKLTNVRSKEISNIITNLVDNIIPLAFYNRFVSSGIDPDDGFLNSNFPSLVRDLTEIQRLKFKRKLYHLIKDHFFDIKDLSRRHFPKTTVKLLKILSTYFFYGNRFKRMKEIHYFMEAYKRGTINEIFSNL
ncbi:hypothetical protein [Persephonella sp.]